VGIDEVATVRSWDPARGSGLILRRAGDDVEISRELLIDGADLNVGDRVAFHRAYERAANDEWGWTIHDVRVVSDEEASALELEWVCRDVTYAEERLSTAQQLASEDDVDTAHEDLARASASAHQRLAEIGRALSEHGGEEMMRRVLDRVDQAYRSSIRSDWQGIIHQGAPSVGVEAE
jgi:hypothetical protein